MQTKASKCVLFCVPQHSRVHVAICKCVCMSPGQVSCNIYSSSATKWFCRQQKRKKLENKTKWSEKLHCKIKRESSKKEMHKRKIQIELHKVLQQSAQFFKHNTMGTQCNSPGLKIIGKAEIFERSKYSSCNGCTLYILETFSSQ